MDDPLVTMTHVRQLHYCASGARTFCERYGLDWREFVRHGLPASQFEQTGDALGAKIALAAREGVR